MQEYDQSIDRQPPVENLGTSDAPVEALTVDIRRNRISNPRFFGKEESWVGKEESWVGKEESWIGKEESWVGKEESCVSNWSPLSYMSPTGRVSGYKTRYSKTLFIRLSRDRRKTTHK
ncbi:hypothetical protein AVEN_93269-1 [Araneus ventricosus]|uniref:Uncharacterized protein n=1 Tax=Araneus ventricosus TaxID=182803 RepID=A0A4Y2P7W1_ARAVE|nr:hypothetical protein AVEN_93269-1 [Araneus ventricosus]